MTKTSTRTISVDAVEDANRSIREAFALGRAIRQWVDEQPSGYGKGVAADARKKFELGNVDDVRKLSLLADPKRGFGREDIASLCTLAKEKRHVLKLTKLKRLLAVRHRRSRLSLAREMITNDWSQAQTEAQIRIKNGGTGCQAAGGRRPRTPQSSQQLLDDLEKIANRWRRYVAVAESSKHWNKLTRPDQRRIKAVSRELATQGFFGFDESQTADG